MKRMIKIDPAGWLKRFYMEESGINTVEIVIILAVLVTLAFIFKDFIMDFANGIFTRI